MPTQSLNISKKLTFLMFITVPVEMPVPENIKNLPKLKKTENSN